MLCNISERMNEQQSARDNMIFSQLITRGITSKEVINALSAVEKEDFVASPKKKETYTDIELPIDENAVVIRSFVFAQILERVIDMGSCDSALIIGDSTGYTSTIFKQIFKKVTLGVFVSSGIEKLREKVDQIPVSFIGEIKGRFDLIFFDSGIFRKETRRKALNILDEKGKMIYFDRELTCDFNEKDADFFDISVIIETHTSKEVLIRQPMYFPCGVIC